MVAGAKATEAKKAAVDFLSPEDVQDMRDFRGSFSGYERDPLFVNAGGRYVECGDGIGLGSDQDDRSVAPMDVDGDGDLDLVLLSLQSLRVLWNRNPARRFLRLRLQATKSEPLALGATVRLSAGGRAQVGRVRLVEGFHTQVSPVLHFGLGDAEAADVEVRWPSGEKQRFAGLKAGQVHVLREGEGATSTPVRRWPDGVQPKVAGRYSLTAAVKTLEGAEVPLGPVGRPVVVNFWAPWCEACEREMPALVALSGELPEAAFVGVSLETKDLDGVKAYAAKHRMSYPLRLATDAVVKSFFGPEGEVALPVTFVFGPDGRTRRAFHREVGADEVRRTLASAQTPASAEDYLNLAGVALSGDDRELVQRLLREVVARATDDPLLLGAAVDTALRAKDVAFAMELATGAVKRFPEHADLLARYATLLGGAGRVDEAAAIIERVLKLAPHNPKGLNAAGMLAMERGDRDGAIRYFERALEADPSFPLALGNLRRARGEPVTPRPGGSAPGR